MRKLILIGIFLVSVLWCTTPTTNHKWVTGEVVTASVMNNNMTSMNQTLVSGNASYTIGTLDTVTVTGNPVLMGTKSIYLSPADMNFAFDATTMYRTTTNVYVVRPNYDVVMPIPTLDGITINYIDIYTANVAVNNNLYIIGENGSVVFQYANANLVTGNNRWFESFDIPNIHLHNPVLFQMHCTTTVNILNVEINYTYPVQNMMYNY